MLLFVRIFIRTSGDVMTATKLTLKLDKDIIEQGKELARRQGTSLSKMVENFLREQVAYDHVPYVLFEPSEEIMALTVDAGPEISDKSDKELLNEYLAKF